MDFQDFYQIVRGIATVESVIVILLALTLMHRCGGWRRGPAADRFRYSGIILLAGAYGYGSIESMLRNVPGGLRVVIGAVALGYLVLAYAMVLRAEKELEARGVQSDGGGVK